VFTRVVSVVEPAQPLAVWPVLLAGSPVQLAEPELVQQLAHWLARWDQFWERWLVPPLAGSSAVASDLQLVVVPVMHWMTVSLTNTNVSIVGTPSTFDPTPLFPLHLLSIAKEINHGSSR
jgi:hypothetical protein